MAPALAITQLLCQGSRKIDFMGGGGTGRSILVVDLLGVISEVQNGSKY